MERENAWKSCNKQTVKEIFGFCEGYKKFISECKTERECTRRSIQMAEEHGYRNLKEIHYEINKTKYKIRQNNCQQ